MSQRHEASILSFPTARGAAPAPREAPARGVVLTLPSRRPDGEGSGAGGWDELTRLALDAWCWRDPESLARLEACVGRLWIEVEREWG